MTDPALTRARELIASLERAGWRGYDPYDALASPLLHRFAVGRIGRQATIQTLKRSPVNLRPALGVPKLAHTKALALIASASVRLAALEPEGPHAERAQALGDDLITRALPAGGGLGWGYDFDVQTRWGHYRRGQPNAVVTSFVANALLDIAELHQDEHALETARRVMPWVMSDLYVEEQNRAFFGYFSGSRRPIHNSSVLVAAVAARCGNDGDRAKARRALHWTAARQRPDGSWPYGEDAGLEWVDGYHTAYILDGLRTWMDRTGEHPFDEVLVRGLSFYLDHLFDPDGAPRATVRTRHPIDIHGASSAITTLSTLRDADDRALPTAERVLAWALAHMVRADGRFAFQLGSRIRKSTAYIRWNDAHMVLALATLAGARAPSHV